MESEGPSEGFPYRHFPIAAVVAVTFGTSVTSTAQGKIRLRMQKLAVLYDASQAVLSTFDLDEVLQRILAILRDFFHVPKSAILLLDSKTGELHCRSLMGWGADSETTSLRIGVGITGTAAEKKRPIYVPDVTLDPRYLCRATNIRSELAIPLMVGDEVVGVLDCQSEEIDPFDIETIDLLTLFSMHASMALRNARLYAEERRRAKQIQAINAIAQQTTAVLDLKELLAKVCLLIKDSFQVAHVSVLLREEDQLVLRAQHGELVLPLLEGGRMPIGAALWGRALEAGATLIENDIQSLPDRVGVSDGAKARICIPLVAFGQSLGVLVMDSTESGAFQPSEIQPLESVADICATAIQNAHYVERVRQLAFLDGLTGIFNRRFFELRILEEIERARRFGGGMAVIMADIDQFKLLNDEFGHLLGDEVLRQVSSLFHQQLRKTDVVCRYGGEEFVILLSQTDSQHAWAVADKLRRMVESWQFPGVPRSVTISAGVATLVEHGESRDELVKAADQGLYLAKQTGRNRVSYPPTSTANRPEKSLQESSI